MNNKYRKEDFGYILSHSYGKVNVYSHDAKPFLDAPPDILAKYEIDSFNIPNVQFHLKSPVYTFLEVTQNCNLTCKHCYNQSGSPRDNELSTGELVHLLDELAKMEVFCVFFTGGEPLMRNDIADLLSYAGSLGFEVGLITNGTLITEKLLEKIPHNTVIGISLDGIENHSKMRGGVSFDDMVKKFMLVKKANMFFSLLTTITKDNIDELEGIFKWSLENEVVFSLQDCLPVGRAHSNMNLLLDTSDFAKVTRIIIIEEEVEELLVDAYRNKNLPLSAIDNFFDFTFRMESATKMCKGGRSVAYITSAGDVYPCSNCAATGLYPAGNIRRSTFDYTWNNSFRDMRSIKWEHFKMCSNCDVARFDCFCQFRCPALSKSLHDELFICGATDYIRKSILLKSILSHIMKSGLSKKFILEHLEKATNENIMEVLSKLIDLMTKTQ